MKETKTSNDDLALSLTVKVEGKDSGIKTKITTEKVTVWETDGDGFEVLRIIFDYCELSTFLNPASVDNLCAEISSEEGTVYLIESCRLPKLDTYYYRIASTVDDTTIYLSEATAKLIYFYKKLIDYNNQESLSDVIDGALDAD